MLDVLFSPLVGWGRAVPALRQRSCIREQGTALPLAVQEVRREQPWPDRFFKTGTIFRNQTAVVLVVQNSAAHADQQEGISALQITVCSEPALPLGWVYVHAAAGRNERPGVEALMGIVEEDETYIGGKEGDKHVGKRSGRKGVSGKTEVIGAISHKGSVVSKMIERADWILR